MTPHLAAGFLGREDHQKGRDLAVAELLMQGHTVRTTVCNRKRNEDVLAILRMAGVSNPQRLTFFTADLEKDQGWAEAVEGCDFVLHLASVSGKGAER